MHRIIAVSILILATPFPSFSQTATRSLSECVGKQPSDHNHGDYHFLTKSRVYKDGGDHIYETCVQNLGSTDLEVNWVIPGPDTVVPVGCAIPATRPHSKRQTIDTYRSCLRYGANWEWDRSPFFPHVSEQEQISDEKGKNCEDVVVSELTTISSTVRDIEFSTERFGPSSYSDFENTLSKISFNIKIDAKPEEGVFVTTIAASFSKAYVEQAEFYSKGFMIRPSDDFVERGFFSNAQGNPLGGFYGGDASIVYALAIPENPVQKFVRYAVFSVDKNRVASIDVPIWVNVE